MKEQYRLLNHGEMMQPGDEFYDRDNTWEQVYPTEACVPKEWDKDTMHPTRRKEIMHTREEVENLLEKQRQNCIDALPDQIFSAVIWERSHERISRYIKDAPSPLKPKP